jgi:hypothetical protein
MSFAGHDDFPEGFFPSVKTFPYAGANEKFVPYVFVT